MDEFSPASRGARPKPRSSPAPFISIGKAIERARQMYGAARHHPAPSKAVVEAWGYGEKSSGGQQTIATLRQFGLLEGRGQNLQLTDLALQIVRDQREVSAERVAAISRAALTPKIHAEMWAKWGADLPSDATIAYYLEHQRGGFTERSSRDLIAQFRETISFAGLANPDKIRPGKQDGDEGSERVELDDSTADPPPPPPPAVQRRVSVMEGERVVFTEESDPQRYIKLVAAGEIDETLLDALTDYVKRQRKRLGLTPLPPPAFGKPAPTILTRNLSDEDEE